MHKHHYFDTIEEIEHKTSKNALGRHHQEYVRRMVGY
jgi:ribosomal protein S21